MKLISLNVEGCLHLDLVKQFFENQEADTICLTESPEELTDWFDNLGYQQTFVPMCIKFHNGQPYQEGLLVASKASHQAEVIPYFTPTTEVVIYDHDKRRETQRHVVLYIETDEINIATTHFTWNPVGEIADDHQIEDMKNMLTALQPKPAHILCGDLNIPRKINHLYDDLTKYYIDNIPPEFNSSLDITLHRSGETPELKKLFDNFMVDYLFTQSPFVAENTKLVFGMSDHAAVVSNVYKVTNY